MNHFPELLTFLTKSFSRKMPIFINGKKMTSFMCTSTTRSSMADDVKFTISTEYESKPEEHKIDLGTVRTNMLIDATGVDLRIVHVGGKKDVLIFQTLWKKD